MIFFVSQKALVVLQIFQGFIESFKNMAINTVNWCDKLWYLKFACCFYIMQE